MVDQDSILTTWRETHIAKLQALRYVKAEGAVSEVNGILIEGVLPNARIGDLCTIGETKKTTLAEVIGFSNNKVLLSALGGLEGMACGATITPHYVQHQIECHDQLLGSVLDGYGRSLSGHACAFSLESKNATYPVINDALAPSKKPRIQTPLATGLKAIDGLMTLGEGQRIGVFAGAGCGKTTLLAELARNMPCDVIVFGLIGERGRELREFLDHELDETLRQRCVLICSTSDKTSMERARAASTATAIAEGFRAQGKRVLLLIDSLTRFARAQRELGLAAGEPPGRGGFPPSVYTMLPRLVERAGNMENAGSITAVYTVLIEGDVIAGDPIADEVRSLLDGHIVLSRQLAEKNHYPAIDVLGSLSRIMSNITSDEHQHAARTFRQLLAHYKDVEMLIQLGEYEPGHRAITDYAVTRYPDILGYLQQGMSQPHDLDTILFQLQELTLDAPSKDT